MSKDVGLTAWQSASNHNRMINWQKSLPKPEVGIEIAYFGGSAFRITTPAGLSLMIDPWRNHPGGTCDWFFHDFPKTSVDIGASTHAHFDHDALHRLDASVLLDRPVGCFEFSDLKLWGIADKHATDGTFAPYDFHRINKYFGGAKITPPDNARSWDNCLLLVETGGLRILHWGDNRHDPLPHVWDMLGRVDILLLPVDDSQHVLGYPMIDDIIARLRPSIVIPHHYFIWNVVLRQSTLFAVEGWLSTQPNVRRIDGPIITYTPDSLPPLPTIDSFGDHVTFDVAHWHRDAGTPVVESILSEA